MENKTATAHKSEKLLSWAESYAQGKAKREKSSRKAHNKWKPRADRIDPVQMVVASEKGRVEELLPLRHGRMVASPFTFYRASALAMATDLTHTPESGIRVQCCGDAHMLNFGGFATPERRVILSINDLDETLPGPWEWDVKRLTTSFVIGCRENGLGDSFARDIAERCARAYREKMLAFSKMSVMDLWYFALDAEMLIGTIKDPQIRQRVIKRIGDERKRSVGENIFPKLAEMRGDSAVIKDQLPAIFHHEGYPPGHIPEIVKSTFLNYQESLPQSYHLLLHRYKLLDAAIKVVGIGSVGTACWVLLLMDGNDDPFFLQIKEARNSVLEAYAGKTIFSNQGQRIVNGYRIMQPYSDIFLGWAKGPEGRDFFIRQLRDMKIGFRAETFGKTEMEIVADWCGWALALSHARSGNPAMLSGYLGKSDTFDKAIGEFSIAYADQNEIDHSIFKLAVMSGKIKAEYESK